MLNIKAEIRKGCIYPVEKRPGLTWIKLSKAKHVKRRLTSVNENFNEKVPHR
ncbi:hypothetical protein EHW99_0317 [Erwinia amylovora]|uniref:Uncharacterized protein n=2 Tax=Erwinia amylovora TaxID=552 RepID=A0A831A298_ERWAM|nr:hypothetical protein EaACW_3324 [Erwinia amylovora ACW56400]QJQ53024.1 hypothetical protein EHX00_0317 [Erwinia amylovora]CBA23405.1 hypothetical protein predicted by Glimmer/Critica [Erwinia amylovora CFBP1430]CBJ44990.1 hypothetical protein EAM_0315 [Erwinia amylovora ATCC 49946]CCO80162.1 hypothetical protein BN432_3392 [Erwinia amylovora Ea356]CCO83966.1 hypothetical protein BN433_3418 [Erwinia amylovora Ea266]CCO87728.1 hypothetical protein BN434_3368 [Erwinia amylovora CFBP 2585]CCO